jgi:hypothetical protein
MYHDFILNLWRGRMAWFQRDSEDENKTLANIADIMTDAVSNADLVSKIQSDTGRNLRDQMSVEEAEQMEAEARYLRMGHRRN